MRRAARHLPLHQNSSLRRQLDEWWSQGILARRFTSLTGDIFDIGLARAEFVRAIDGETNAWHQLVTACRHGGTAIDDWVLETNLDVAWIREWLGRVAVIIRRHGGTDIYPIDTMIDGGGGKGAPDPSVERILGLLGRREAFARWLEGESPPDPLTESWSEFEERMRQSWELRIEAVGGALGKKRTIAQHAEWTARFQVGDESVADIVESESVGKDAIRDAIERFASLIELPLREKP